MCIFLDTSDLSIIEYYLGLGVIRGVTTNPSIFLKMGVTNMVDHIVKLCKLLDPFPVSVEVTSNIESEMVEQALRLSDLGENIVVKIPIQGPNDETFNLRVVNLLEDKYGRFTNVTACMSSSQIIMAGLAGATYASLFGGRISNMGHDVIAEIKKSVQLLDRLEYRTQLIVGSTRESINIVDWLLAGADIITVTPDLMKNLITHPYSRDTVRQFLNDAQKLNG